jgi:hypothetical protein
LKAAIDSSSRANQFELGSDPDSVSWLDDCIKALWLVQLEHLRVGGGGLSRNCEKENGGRSCFRQSFICYFT